MKHKKAIGMLICLMFLLSFVVPLIDLPFRIKNVSGNPSLSTNYLFRDKTYQFNLDDFYDDENLNKIYTGAKFQTEDFNGTDWSGTIDNDTVSPVNNIETEYASPSGHYNATYSFEEFADGTEGYDIIDFVDYYNAPSNCYAKIVSEMGNHKKVLEISDDNNAGILSVRHYYDEIQTNSTVEFWWRYDGYLSYQHYLYMRFREGDIERVRLIFGYVQVGQICSHNGTVWIPIVSNLPTNTWYHIKIVFDDSANTFDFYVDEENKGTFVYFFNSAVGLNKIYMETRDTGDNYHHWLDAFGFSFDPYYTIGNNLYPENFNMIDGSYDYTDNMKVLDDTFSTFTSTYPYGTLYESPIQWDDFDFTKGSGGAIGELETNNGNFSRIDAGFTEGSESFLGYIKPADSDIYISWNEGDGPPHWSKLDEYPDIDGDGGNIRETFHGTWDRWNFNTLTLPAGHIVSKLVVHFYATKESAIQDTNIKYTLSTGQNDIFAPTTSYAWHDFTHSGLSITQSQSNAFWVNVEPFFIEGVQGWVDIETVYVDVYSKLSGYSCDYEIVWDVSDLDLESINTFYYDYRTTVEVDCDLDIYNWETTGWLELESNTASTYITDSYALTDPYINASNYVKIRFQTDGYSDFDMELDQIVLGYYNTSSKGKMNCTIGITLDDYNEDLLYLNVSSWHRTNISQTINFKIWNVGTSTWNLISSSSSTSFTNYTLGTTSMSNYIDSLGHVYLQYSGYTYTVQFEHQIDCLLVRIYYKLDLVHSKSFNINGIYRYRWCIFGSIHYTQWVSFEVVDPIPNFHAISESDYITRWILQGSDISPVVDFTDDISSSNWDLDGISNRIMKISRIPTDDSYVSSKYTTTNYGTLDDLYAYGDTGAWMGRLWTYLKAEYSYLDLNYTSNSTLYINTYLDTNGLIDVYLTNDFSESIITWNNKPDMHTLQVENIDFDLGWKTYTIGSPSYYYGFNCTEDSNGVWLYSSESSYKPIISHYLSKNYQGSGYTYMQTNTTETIALKSNDYGTHYNLSSGDYFEVDFQTNSDSQINLILLKNGVINKTLTLSQSGNTNFNKHIVQVSVDEFVEFDQLKISSTFEDIDYIKVYDIKTYKYTLTGDYADFYIGSHNQRDIYLNSDNYNLRIFEEDTKKVDTNITIGSSDYYYVYDPIETIQCRLTLFSMSGEYLQFEDYHIKINRSLSGEYNQFWLVDTIFYADDGSYVYIEVYDRFDASINNFTKLASPYIDLNIEVYSLQIKNLQTQQTTVDINNTHIYQLLSGDSLYFMLAKAYYKIGYYDTNIVYKQFTIYLDSNQAYELNRSKICFLSYADQQGNHLSFENYKTYINGTLLYENIFYREIGDNIGIEIKDRYDISILNDTYMVISGDNYIPITLTLYSLKVMNLQLCFNHINITRDPNYYESDMYWSEWVAPYEVIKFRLFSGYYKINLTNYEDETYSYYAYTLNGDDMLLIGSNQTIYNVLLNIANVNATIGNQITNVQIDLTNQNSAINNSIINVDINLGNVNSTLGNMLVNLDVDINNIANNISEFYSFTNTSFINLNNVMNTSFINIESNIISINQSISNLIIGVSNDIYLVNGTISTMISQLETNLLLMNVSIDTALFDISTTLSQIGSNITSNFILLNNSIYLNNLNINDSRIAIINNLALINNTISTLIANVYSAVYLVNNSIYTAVVDLGTYLGLMNNTIYGNLSIVLEQNEFLTELYQMTMFSELLNWTNIGLNISLLTSQIDVWTFVNNYINQSIEVHLRYQDLIEKLIISADDSKDQWLPSKDVEYNLWSVADEEYLDEWKELDPENKTVDFGFYKEEVPDIPDFNVTNTWLMLILIILGFIGIIGFVGYFTWKYYKRVQRLKERYIRQQNIDKDLIKNFTGGRRIK